MLLIYVIEDVNEGIKLNCLVWIWLVFWVNRVGVV